MSRLIQLFDFLEAQPNDPFILFALAKEYEKASDDGKALEFYQRLQATTPQYVGLYYHLGKLFERLNDPQNALHIYRKGIEIAQKERDFHAMNELKAAKANISDDDDDEY